MNVFCGIEVRFMKRLFPIMIIFSSMAYAGQIDDSLDACLDKSFSTPEISLCYSNATDEWDKELNIEYKKLLSILDNNQRKTLVKAQKSWLEYRDNYYSFLQDFYTRDGTMWGNLGAEKRMELVKEKVNNLKSLFDNVQPK